MHSKDDAKNLIDKVIGYSKLPECEVDLSEAETVFIRFANNGITTAGYQITQQISITSVTDDKRSGNSVITEFGDEALRIGVQQTEDLAKISNPDPEHVSPLGPQQYPTLHNFDQFTSSARGNVMIPQVKAIIDAARSKDLVSAGFITRSLNVASVGNKAGLFGYHTYTDSSLTSTMRNAAGTSSGWATQTSTSMKDLDGQVIGRISSEKCASGSDAKRKLDPGKYTVILEPAAVSDLIGYFGFGIGAREAEQGQSFLSKKDKAARR